MIDRLGPVNPGHFWRLATVAVVGTVLLSLTLGLAIRPSPYSLLLPGSVVELGPRIELPAGLRRDSGWLALTAVRVGQASYASWLRAQLDPSLRLVPTATMTPPGASRSQYRANLVRWAESARAAAAVVALRRAGYPVEVGGRGVLVDGVVPDTGLSGLIRPGDVILAVDGQPTPTTADLVERLGRIGGDRAIGLEILRDGDHFALEVPPPASPARGWSSADLYGWNYVFDVRLPIELEILPGDDLGDSAGLMLSLGILDALTPGDLAGGLRVAGSGTIDLDGSVGPIDGVAQKVQAAEQHGAQLFLAPRENAAEAERAARGLRVIPVGSFEEALAALEALGGGLER